MRPQTTAEKVLILDHAKKRETAKTKLKEWGNGWQTSPFIKERITRILEESDQGVLEGLIRETMTVIDAGYRSAISVPGSDVVGILEIHNQINEWLKAILSTGFVEEDPNHAIRPREELC